MGRRAAMATTHVASRILGRMPFHGDWVLFLPVGDPRSLRKMVTFVITHYGSHRANNPKSLKTMVYFSEGAMNSTR